MWHSYSPLFTLGLLADHSPDPRSPTTSLLEESPSPADDASAIYFTLKRETAELRSFLYLDLAHRKHHAPSHKRKQSTLTKCTSWTCTTDAKSYYDFARTEKPTMTVSPTVPMVPARRRTSKESLRNIPSPKPAPSATLPDLPVVSGSRPSPKERSVSAVAPATPPRARRPGSSRSESISSQDRRKSRMDALACLEGRVLNRASRGTNLRNNFMSFSDDEDSKSSTVSTTSIPEAQPEDLSAFADVEDEADVDVRDSIRRSEASDVAKPPVRPSRTGRKRRSTLESWFPLKSFIDLKDDDLSWNWRSFIEIGGVA